MINHVLTLMANIDGATAALATGTYIDPTYTPVVTPRPFRGVDVVFWPDDADERAGLAKDVVKACRNNELEPYLKLFDARTTKDVVATSVVDLLNAEVTGMFNTAITAVNTTGGLIAVDRRMFIWDTYQDELDELYKVWTHYSEGMLRVCAMALAYAFMLEKARTGA